MKTRTRLPRLTLQAIYEAWCYDQNIPVTNVRAMLNNCYSVAQTLTRILQGRGMKARSVYGVYCAGGGAALARHGWTQVGSKVYDPTRWAFEGVEPYLYIGKIDEEYDEGSWRYKAEVLRRQDPPRPGPQVVLEYAWSRTTERSLAHLLVYSKNVFQLTQEELYWLSQVPPPQFPKAKTAVPEFYTVLNRKGFLAMVPIDSRAYAQNVFNWKED